MNGARPVGCVDHSPGGVADSFRINIGSIVPSADDVGGITSHELGHTMGLDDCPSCCPGTSTMASPSGSQTGYPNATLGPSTCDAVRATEEVGTDPDTGRTRPGTSSAAW